MLPLMSVLEQKDKFPVFTAIASEYYYKNALSVRQAPQPRRRIRNFTNDRIRTIELTCIAGSISAASTASRRESLSLPAILLYEIRITYSNKANAISRRKTGLFRSSP